MLRILGRRTSSNVEKVLWTATELGIPFTREDVGGPFGGNRTPDYLAMNPNGLVPTVIDGDLVMWESNSVCRYICNKFGGDRLYPKAPERRVLIERWMDWQLSVVVPAVVPLFMLLVRTPEDKRDPAIVAKLAGDAEAPFKILERHLAGRKYLEGEDATLADIGPAIWTYRWFTLGYGDRNGNLGAWYRRMTERPAFREHIMIPLA